MLRALDPKLYPIVVQEDWTFVTNDEGDFTELAELAALHQGLIFMPQSLREIQQARFDEIITYIEWQAGAAHESPADWMVLRVVKYEADGAISHGWLPG